MSVNGVSAVPTSDNARIVVVKVGGSLHEHPQLRSWLSNIVTHGGGRAVIVPGGGPYADLVRRAQSKWGFSDHHAHHMALQAMDQFGHLLVALEPRLMIATSEPQLRGQLSRREAVVCMSPLYLADKVEQEESWDVTADSIALLLAQQLRASALVLLKSIGAAAGSHQAATLSQRGIIDKAFPRYLTRALLPVWWLGPDNPAQARNIFEGGSAEAVIVP